MLKHTGTALAALMLLGACGGNYGASIDSAVNDKDNGAPTTETRLSIEYEKFTLENGLEVILHVDRSDPIVAFTTVIHAGSNREKTGRTGFAHFFEHMAFNDSENVPRGWNRKAIPDWGGSRNGGTWSDGTIYYEVVPKDAFDKIMWIDSDRLGYMINTVTTAALEREKQVVKNEKRQRVDNAPYGYTQEVIKKALYPENHPYNWTVIGSLPDLQAATLEDLREFYDQYYGASNATLAIVGDIDIEETKAKVERWFGEIRRGPDIEPLPPMPVSLDETKKLYFEDNFAKLPEVRLTFPTVESYNEDELALNVLGQILAGSKNSVLHQIVVDEKKLAPSVSAFHNAQEIAGEFVIRIRGNADTDLDDVEAAITEAMTRFEENGVDPDDLKRIKAERETQLYAGVSTVLGKSNEMASANEFAGDPVYAIKQAEQLDALTAEDVVAAYNSYIKGKPTITTSFVPKGKMDLAIEGSELATVWIEEVVSGVANEEVSQGELAVYEKTPSKYDRSEPPFGDLPLVKMPNIWDADLGGGITMLGIENDETPLINFDITLPGGAWLDPAGQKGTTRLLARLMNEGTASKTAAELEQAIGLLGSGIQVSAGSDEIRISGTALARNFEETLAIVEEAIANPRWQEDDFDRVKSAMLTSITGRQANPNAIGSLAFSNLIYGDEHPLGTSVDGDLESVNSIDMDDLKTHHAKIMSGTPRIHVAGDITPEAAKSAFSGIAGLFDDGRLELPSYDIPEQDKAGNVYFIDVPGSKQSVLLIGKLTLSTLNEDANRLDFTNEKLGGGISGDLAQTLRIEKGYTYGAVSFVPFGLVDQPFQIRTSVRANATRPSLEIIKDMVINYGPDFSDEDVETTRQKLIKQNTRAFESLNAKLGTLRSISKYGFSRTYVEDNQEELLAMTREDFAATAAEYLQEDEMIYVIVGDKATQFEEVQTFAGGDVLELDTFGKPVE